jgi:hypothetical protein
MTTDSARQDSDAKTPAATQPRGEPTSTPPEPTDAVNVHDPRLSAVRIAGQLDDLARALTYTTRPGDPRLGRVPDIYSVLGSLHEALAKLPQICGQIATALGHHEVGGQLRAAPGFPHAGDPRLAVIEAVAELRVAAAATAAASTALVHAQSAISGLSHTEAPRADHRHAFQARPVKSPPSTPPPRGGAGLSR